jgi:hypothetical protein
LKGLRAKKVCTAKTAILRGVLAIPVVGVVVDRGEVVVKCVVQRGGPAVAGFIASRGL